MADSEVDQNQDSMELGLSETDRREFEDEHPSPSDAALSDGEMREEIEREEREREQWLQKNWPTLYAEKKAKDEKREREQREREQREREQREREQRELAEREESEKREREQDSELQRREKQMREREARFKRELQRQHDREQREKKLQEIKQREENLRLRELELEANIRRFEELQKEKSQEKSKEKSQEKSKEKSKEKRMEREELERLKAQKSLAEEAKKVEEFADELKLRLKAICSMYSKASGAGTSGTSFEETPMDKSELPETSKQQEIGEGSDDVFKKPYQFNISQLKGGLNKWKEGEDYRLWRRIAFLEFAKFDCRFLVDRNVEPLRKYTPAEKRMMESAVMEYILSNFPEKYQHMLDDCETSLEMIRELDQAIIPTTDLTEEVHHIQLMNLYHDPARETVVEFRARVQQLVNNIRRHPNHELSQSTIRRNVLGAISGAYPTIYREACENASMSLNEIFTRMSQKKITHGDLVRRAAGSGSALVAGPGPKAGPSGRNLRKRKAPPTQGDSAAVDKSETTCYKCGFKGHWIAECRNPGRGCYNCHGFGHEARDCKKPKGYSWRKPQPGKRFKKSGKEHTPAQNRLEKSKKGKPKGKPQLKSVVKKVDGEKRDVVAAIAARAQGESSPASPSSYATALSFEGKTGQLNFIADSGACEHMVSDISVFSELRNLAVPITILCANKNEKASLKVSQIGDIIVFNRESRKYSLLTDVLYAPGLLQNLFAIRKQIDRGLVAKFNTSTLEIVDESTGVILKRGHFIGRFWWLSFELPMINKSREENVEMVRQMRNQLNLVVTEKPVHSFSTGDGEALGTGSNVKESESSISSTNSQLKRKHSQNISERKRSRHSVEESGGSKDLGTVAATEQGSQPQERLRDDSGLKWHHRFNHASKKYLEIASKVMPELKGVQFKSDLLDCAPCKQAKAKRKSCSEQRHRSEQPFHRLYSDLVGPLKPGAFRSQARYFVTFTDDASRYAFAYEIDDKTRVNRALSSCLEDIRKLTGPDTKVAELRVDGGLEYQTMEMRELLKSERIAATVCEPYTPQHNGAAERLNLELEEKIRVNLIASGLPTYLWPFTMRHVLHVHNRTPNASNEFRSPYEVLKGEVPSIKHLRRYGCEAYVLDPQAKKKSKFAPRANLHFLVECGDTGYTLFHPVNRTVTRSKDVDFIEDRTYSDYVGNPEIRMKSVNREVPEFEPESEEELAPSEEASAPTEEGPKDAGRELEKESESQKRKEMPSTSQKIGETREFDFFEEDEVEEANLMCILHSQLEADEQEPGTYKDAMNSVNVSEWKKAIEQEFQALEKCKTWKIVDRSKVPKGTKIMTTRWVNKRKIEANGSIRFRSRLVVRGFADTNSYELSEIYAPVARLPDVRFVLIAAAKFGLELHQLDVKTAFLNGSLDKLVYIELPEGYSDYLGKRRRPQKNSVCEVHRALYGLKVSPRRWYERFLEAVRELKFEAYKFQPCLFIWRDGNKLAIMLLYVDDILLASNCSKKSAEVKSTLQQEFSITDLGAPKKFLGMEIVREKSGEIRLHQKQHIEAMLQKFRPGKNKRYATPMVAEFGDGHALKSESTAWKRESIPYRQAIGTLLYLQNGTRPDISYAVNALSRRQSDFTEKHWEAILRVMGYLDATKDLYLNFKPTSGAIDCFVDASLGMSAELGHSTTGFVIYMFGCPVTWRTQKQNHVALSSAEAEFVAMSKACRELANIRVMCSEILRLQIVPTIFEDSKPAIRLAEVDDSSTLKHLVRLSYLYVREEHKNGNVKIIWVGTEDQVGDLFTKPLSKSKFVRFRDRLMSS